MARFLWNRPASPEDADNPVERVDPVRLVGDGRSASIDWWTSQRVDVRARRPRDAGIESRLVDEQDFEVAAGEVGDLIVRHREPWTINQGYHVLPR